MQNNQSDYQVKNQSKLTINKNSENVSSIKKLKIRTSDKLTGATGNDDTNKKTLQRQATNSNLSQIKKISIN